MLLVIPLKTTKRMDIAKPLATWVNASHPHYTSEECRDDLIRLSSLRNCLSDALNTSSGHASAVMEDAFRDLMEYHGCLVICERCGFPAKDDPLAGATELKLRWSCAFADCEDEPAIRSNIRHERSCVLFDVAALESYRAINEDRSTKDGRARAMRGFQQSAATLEFLRDVVSGKVDDNNGAFADNNPPADLADATLLLCRDLMLAQAQLCAYEAALARPNPMHALLAKIASGAADLYDAALTRSQDGVVRARLPKTSAGWGAHAKATSMIFRARSEHHAAMAARQHNVVGDEIARLRRVELMCEKALKFHKDAEIALSGIKTTTTLYGAASSLADREHETKLLQSEIEGLRKRAKERRIEVEKDNRKIYHEDVPKDSDLSPIQPQSLVSTMPPISESLDPYALARPFMASLPLA